MGVFIVLTKAWQGGRQLAQCLAAVKPEIGRNSEMIPEFTGTSRGRWWEKTFVNKNLSDLILYDSRAREEVL